MAELAVTILGVDHHRTPVAIRECLSAQGERLDQLLRDLTTRPGVDEVVVLSTCNRFELILAGRPDLDQVISLLAERSGVTPADLQEHRYLHHGAAAIRHCFRVVASLESLVLGEYQITHQVKEAYETAQRLGCTGSVLNPLLQRALSVGKEVRSQTAIGRHKLSVASVAVDLAAQILGDLGPTRLLVLGAGEIAELAVTHLQAAGVHRITICNRSEGRAVALAEGAQAAVLPWDQRAEGLIDHDIVVASTAAPGFILDEEMIRAAMKRRRQPLMLLDLAVPRDIEDRASRIEDVYLYNVDHLEAVVAANRKLRGDEVAGAEALIDAQVEAFRREQQGGGRAALLGEVSAWFADIVAAEAARLKGRCPEADADQLRYGLERVANKLAHRILRHLKDHPEDESVERQVRALLDLDATRDQPG